MANETNLHEAHVVWWMLSTAAQDPIHDCNRNRLSNTFKQMDVIVKKIKEIAPEDAFRRAAAEAARLHRGGGKGRTRKGKFIQRGGAKAEEIRILGKALWICKKALPQLIMVSMEYIQQILLLFILEFPRNMRSIRGGHTPFQMRERILHQGMNDGWNRNPEEARVAATFAYVTKYTDHWVEEEVQLLLWIQEKEKF